MYVPVKIFDCVILSCQEFAVAVVAVKNTCVFIDNIRNRCAT